MLKINKKKDAIIVEGINNNLYPDNARLSFPLNSLILNVDKSDIATFRSAANNDVLFSSLIKDITINDAAVDKLTIIDTFNDVSNAPQGGVSDAYTKQETDNLLKTKENKVIEITQSEYDALETKAVDTMYIITDAVNDYYTQEETDNLLKTKENKVITLTQEEYNNLPTKAVDTMYLINDAKVGADVFDATPLYVAATSNSAITPEFKAELDGAINDKKVLVIKNTDVNVYITLVKKINDKLVFTAADSTMFFTLELLNDLTVKYYNKSIANHYVNNAQQTNIFNITVGITDPEIRTIFTTTDNGVRIPQEGDTFIAKDSDNYTQDSAIVISSTSVNNHHNILLMSNNLINEYFMFHQVEIESGLEFKVIEANHTSINPSLISEDALYPIVGNVFNKGEVNEKLSLKLDKSTYDTDKLTFATIDDLNNAIGNSNAKITEINNKIGE